MRNALEESTFIFERLIYCGHKKQIVEFIEEVQIKQEKYETEILWVIDQEIGGIGGYCMPADPTRNPFPGGLNRELFRPLQYARSEIDICDIRMHSRQVVHYSGMHLEAVFKHFLTSIKYLGKIRYYNLTLGKATREISKLNIFDEVLIESLYKFVALYNKAKHEVNMIEDRPRMFSVEDAIVCYFSARIIGQVALTTIKYPLALESYKINDE